MRISELTGRNLGLLGFGVEGRATLAALRRAGHNQLVHVLLDSAVAVPEGVELHVGADSTAAIAPRLDVVVRSPGFAPHHPLRVSLDALGITQTTATRLLLRELRSRGLPVIAITGSKGKSTTSVLTHMTLGAAGIQSVLVGNVGVPGLELLDQICNERAVTVLELSSYQCADLETHFGPDVAGLLDLFPEHLDWHGTLDAYYAAKLRIALTQREGDCVWYNMRSEALLRSGGPLLSRSHAMNTEHGLRFDQGWFYDGSKRLFADSAMQLRGRHNRENAVAALALSGTQGAGPEHLQQVLGSFRGLPYRLQNEGVHGGIHWVNDSISTAPEVVAAALQAFESGSGVSTLIVGGHSRGLDQKPLIPALMASKVRTLITLPDTGADIVRCVRSAALDLRLFEANSLEDAVSLAVEHTPAGETCLFSPGAPSYNRYRSFEERGKHLRALVEALDPTTLR